MNLTKQNQEATVSETQVNEKAKRLFVEPEITGSEDILETTAFFQVITGGTDVGPDIT